MGWVGLVMIASGILFVNIFRESFRYGGFFMVEDYTLMAVKKGAVAAREDRAGQPYSKAF